jgi:hypothetical protein
LFDPNGNPALIAPKKLYKRVKLFGAGRLNRLVLDALRDAGRPLTTAEVVERICASLSYGRSPPRGCARAFGRTCIISGRFRQHHEKKANAKQPIGIGRRDKKPFPCMEPLTNYLLDIHRVVLQKVGESLVVSISSSDA